SAKGACLRRENAPVRQTPSKCGAAFARQGAAPDPAPPAPAGRTNPWGRPYGRGMSNAKKLNDRIRTTKNRCRDLEFRHSSLKFDIGHWRSAPIRTKARKNASTVMPFGLVCLNPRSKVGTDARVV